MTVSSCTVSILFLVMSIFTTSDSQLSAMFGNPIQADNCRTWTEWGPCVWLKGKQPRWQRSYFDQLLPGRKGCRQHVFFRLLRDRWGVLALTSYFNQLLDCCTHPSIDSYEWKSKKVIVSQKQEWAFNNFYNYLRDVTLSEEQCGQCSYQQSCGRQCHRRGDVAVINPLFVAERRCPDVEQSSACVSKFVTGCKLWPNPEISLPNVTSSMQQIIDGLDYLTCVPENRHDGAVCRCCCHPYAPNPTTFLCEIKPYLNAG